MVNVSLYAMDQRIVDGIVKTLRGWGVQANRSAAIRHALRAYKAKKQ